MSVSPDPEMSEMMRMAQKENIKAAVEYAKEHAFGDNIKTKAKQ